MTVDNSGHVSVARDGGVPLCHNGLVHGVKGNDVVCDGCAVVSWERPVAKPALPCIAAARDEDEVVVRWALPVDLELSERGRDSGVAAVAWQLANNLSRDGRVSAVVMVVMGCTHACA